MDECDFRWGEETYRESRPDAGGIGNVYLQISAAVQPLYQPIVEKRHQLAQAWCHAAVGVAGKLQVNPEPGGFAGNAGLVCQQHDRFI